MSHGWFVVACAFLVALCGFGFGFYGPGLYLVTLRAAHGWPIALLSSAVSVYYLCAALGTVFVGDAMGRFGPRPVVVVGSVAMSVGIGWLTVVQTPGQVYAAFVVMSLGWAAMSGAAVSTMVAPWFEERRGLAISLALNGGSCGGILVTPLLIFLIARYGFRRGMWLALAGMMAVLLPSVLLVLGPHHRRPFRATTAAAPAWSRRGAMRDPAFLTISIPFALAFLAQVGLLTHQIAYLLPIVGAGPAAWLVSLTTAAAVVGRTVTGSFVDRVDRRLVSCANFSLQAAALAVLLSSASPAAVYAGTVLFGLGVGNLNTLPALIVQQEFPREHFGRIVSLVIGINQFAFALGPAILGALRDWSGDYRTSFLLCLLVDVAAAVLVLRGRHRAHLRQTTDDRRHRRECQGGVSLGGHDSALLRARDRDRVP